MESVRIFDRASGAAIAAEFIKNISYNCVLDSTPDFDVFSYIAVNKQLVRCACCVWPPLQSAHF
jgi:hypothetical protein